jgi:uncharacterized membrane protein
VYLGRLANLALYVVLVFLALRLAPAHRWTLCMVALVPTSIFQAASLSADVLTNAISWLFLAAVLGAAARPGPIARRELGLLLGLAALLGGLKPPAAVLSPLVLLVPAERFGDRRRWLAAGAGALAAAASTSGLWLGALAQYQLPTMVVGADAAAQLRGMLAEPLAFGALLAKSVSAQVGSYGRTLVGVLGWVDTPLPVWVYPAWWAAVVAVAVFDGGAASPVRGVGRALCIGLALAGSLVAVTLIYLLIPVGADPIVGVQGRYFLPFLPLALFALHRRGQGGLPQWAVPVIPVFCAVILAVALATTGARYYGAS